MRVSPNWLYTSLPVPLIMVSSNTCLQRRPDYRSALASSFGSYGSLVWLFPFFPWTLGESRRMVTTRLHRPSVLSITVICQAWALGKTTYIHTLCMSKSGGCVWLLRMHERWACQHFFPHMLACGKEWSIHHSREDNTASLPLWAVKPVMAHSLKKPG